MSVSGKTFKVKCSLKVDNSSAMVYYKQDGQRFDVDRTIKLKVATPYMFNVTFQPPHKIKSATLRGEQLEINGEESTHQHSRYSMRWNSDNLHPTKKNHRVPFTLVLEVENVGLLQLPFQFKFYEANDTGHSTWGKSLNHIEYDCVQRGEHSFVEIARTLFR